MLKALQKGYTVEFYTVEFTPLLAVYQGTLGSIINFIFNFEYPYYLLIYMFDY